MLQIILGLIGIRTAVYILPCLQKRVSARTYCQSLRFFFTIYAIGNIYFTLFSRVPMPEVSIEWRPFASYVRMLQETGDMVGNELKGWLAEFFLTTSHPIQTIILNILLYVPLGYLLPELFCKLSSKQVLIISFLATFCTELTQLIFKLGWCETDDLIHNMLGAVVGLAIHRWQEKKCILNTQN